MDISTENERALKSREGPINLRAVVGNSHKKSVKPVDKNADEITGINNFTQQF